MAEIKQKIRGNNNIQVGGDLIKTEKIVHKTEIIYDKDILITDEQAKEIRDKIHKIAQSSSSENKYSYKHAFTSFYNRFHITGYKLLPKEKYKDAIMWLDKQIAINRPKLRVVDNEQYRKDMYSAIHAKASQLNLDVHDFATNSLCLKKANKSLTELSDTRLKKLYTKLFSIKIK